MLEMEALIIHNVVLKVSMLRNLGQCSFSFTLINRNKGKKKKTLISNQTLEKL